MIGIMEFKVIVTVRFEMEREGRVINVLAQSERAQKCQGNLPSFRFHS